MRENIRKIKSFRVTKFFHTFAPSNQTNRNMNKVSNDIKWFCNQLRQAEQILNNALEESEEFSEHDKRIIDRIRADVEMTDLTLLQLLSPIAPGWAMGTLQ